MDMSLGWPAPSKWTEISLGRGIWLLLSKFNRRGKPQVLVHVSTSSTQLLEPRPYCCGGQNRFGIPSWGFRCTTHFRTYFRGDWDVHRGYRVLTHGHIAFHRGVGPVVSEPTVRLALAQQLLAYCNVDLCELAG